MAQKRIVPFISDDKLIDAVGKVVKKAKVVISKVDNNLDRNMLDPFLALFSQISKGGTYAEWIESEKVRQINKGLEQAIGEFHESIIGGIDGWEKLLIGERGDVRCEKLKIVAEIKNKFNTVTGQHLPKIYDELKLALEQKENKGFKAYYVPIIAKKSNHVKTFIPSDSHAKGKDKRRPEDERIIEMSGFLFYDLATGHNDALFSLYKALPGIMRDKFGFASKEFDKEEVLNKIFERTYLGKRK